MRIKFKRFLIALIIITLLVAAIYLMRNFNNKINNIHKENEKLTYQVKHLEKSDYKQNQRLDNLEGISKDTTNNHDDHTDEGGIVKPAIWTTVAAGGLHILSKVVKVIPKLVR